MSLKGLFDKVTVAKSLVKKSQSEIAEEVESVSYHNADVTKEKRFIPPVDYSKPENFARYGSAEKYYTDSITNIFNTYPYDGSLFERLQWENSSSYIDLYIFENRYPRTNGYINFCYGGWGSRTGSKVGGYGLPASKEYISIKGGPGTGGGPQTQGANIWSPTDNRESNLELNPVEGTSVEFWLKKDAWDPTDETEKEVIFDLWNNELSSSAAYGRLRIELTASGHATAGANPFLITLMSGTTGFQMQSIGSTAITTASVGDGNWHHYAFSFKSASAGVAARLYVDGKLNTDTTVGSAGVEKVSGSMLAYLGALRTNVSGNAYDSINMTGSGKLSGSLDEFRYWKTQRTSKDIGRYWFTQVGGGTNTDITNTNLGVYYKFNEGITGNSSVDAVVLDFSGRVTNGSWTGYVSGSRNTGSAIVESKASVTEFQDPIIYSNHPEIITLSNELKNSGSAYDYNNNASIYHMFPSWMQEEDSNRAAELRNLTQIISSYFDSAQLQIQSLPEIHNVEYTSGSNKPNVFAERLLDARGFLSPEIFMDADALEKLGDRSENLLFSSSLNDTKNIIYQNIYNNLINIYKSKGTMKSFRNLMRCYGIDEELIKINLYASGVNYELRDNTTLAETRTRLIDFNHTDRFNSTVFQNSSSTNASSVSFITGGVHLKNGFATTLETEILFPKKFSDASENYATQNFTALSSSLFGLHKAISATPAVTTWAPGDEPNFQVFAVREEVGSTNAKFVLSSSAQGSIPFLSSSVFNEVYDNTKWSLAVRIKPETYPYSNFISGSDLDAHNCIMEFYGVHIDAGVVIDEFSLTSSVSMATIPVGFFTGSKRVYVGSHRENFTGSALQGSDAKIASCRYWFDYVDDKAIKAHAQNVSNYGALNASRPAYLFQNDLASPEVMEIDTLALNWDFEQVTTSDASGEFVVADFSSGSSDAEGGRYSYLGPSLSYQHTGRGYEFPVSSAKVVDVDFLVSAKQNLPENLQATDMIKILSQQDDVEFTRDSRPINFYFAFEKSMYQAISEEMINIFGTIVDFNNLIGEPVNRYRAQYKRLGKLRNLFFERIGNTPDLDKYIEFYKWFDSALSEMIAQLIPASVDSSEGVRVVVENHLLVRDKYQHKFPTLEMKVDDPEGSIQTVLNASPGWKFTHAPVPLEQDNNANWWLHRAGRNVAPLSSSDTGVNNSRSMILRATYNSYDRKRFIPHRFRGGFSHSSSLTFKGGPNPQYQKNRDVVYAATAPAGPLVPGTNIPANIMIAQEADVIKHQDINDIIYPNAKKVVGFKLDPTINKDTDYSGKGELLAPFSLYSGSGQHIETGYNSVINTQFASGVLLTNLHPDVYGPSYEVPMQGPFTEKFVGGREHRHIWINQSSSRNPDLNGLDSPEDRAEGYRILCGACLGTSSGSLGIAGPQYPDPASPYVVPPYLYDRPKANLLRIESAKRPVNIKNILMTTASLGTTLSGTIMHNQIGNYQKTYQVIQTAGRTLNDPFFQDQSFQFMIYPETLATYGRLPLTGMNSEAESANPQGALNEMIPERTGSDSNQAVIVNKFSAPGSYEAMSLGYLVPPHEEKSVYNALPYRNLTVRSSGSGESDSQAVNDQLNKRRGLRTLETLHCGQFGADGQFGSVTALNYVTVPSYQKINKNRRQRIEYSDSGDSGIDIYQTTATGSRYDNGHVTHLIPQSDKQYAWISGSLGYPGMPQPAGDPAALFLGYDQSSGSIGSVSYQLGDSFVTSSNTFTRFYDSTPAGTDNVLVQNFLISETPFNATPLDPSDYVVLPGAQSLMWADFAGLNMVIYEPITSSINHTGYAAEHGISYIQHNALFYASNYLSTNNNVGAIPDQLSCGLGATIAYYYDPFVPHPWADIDPALAPYDTRPAWSWTSYKLILNALLAHRGSQYKFGTFGQLNMSPRSKPILRYQRKNNIVSLRDKEIQALNWRGNTISQWIEPPIASEQLPLQHRLTSKNRQIAMAGNPPTPPLLQTLVLDHSFGNKITDFSNQVLNNRLGMENETWRSDLYFNRINSTLLEEFSETDDSPFEDIAKVTLDHKQKIYPAGYNSFLQTNRARKLYNTDFVWKDNRAARSAQMPARGSISKRGSNPNEANFGRNHFPTTPADPWTGPFRDGVYSRQAIYDAPWMGSSSLPSFENPWNGGTLDGLDIRYAQALGIFSYPKFFYGVSIWPLDEPHTTTYNVNSSVTGRVTNNLDPGVGISITVTGAWNQEAYQYYTPGFHKYDRAKNGRRFVNMNGGQLHSQRRIGAFQSGNIAPVPQYALPVPMGWVSGGVAAYGGWAINEVATQAGRSPYPDDYDFYMQNLRRVGKDYSIVPEFRISQHMEYYLIESDGDYLADNDFIFELTGAQMPGGSNSGSAEDSATASFFKTYSNSDFMKLFEVVDEAYNNKDTTTGLTFQKDSLSLKCNALLKFLPYRGFYPAERVTHLASLYSSSYGQHTSCSILGTPWVETDYGISNESPGGAGTGSGEYMFRYEHRSYRAMTDPLFGPGILLNTIKSGLACETLVFVNSSSASPSALYVGQVPDLACSGGATPAGYPKLQPEGVIIYTNVDTAGKGSPTYWGSVHNYKFHSEGSNNLKGWSLNAKPFEALLKPDLFLSENAVSGGCIYDNGIGSSSLCLNNSASSGSAYDGHLANYYGLARAKWTGDGDDRYRYAIDNFLCAVTDFWQGKSPTSFVSKPQNQWGELIKGKTYGLTLRLYRTLSGSVDANSSLGAGDLADRASFENYNRASAFGVPIACQSAYGAAYSPDYQQWVPPYFYGFADVQITYTPDYSGEFTLAELRSSASYNYRKQRAYSSYNLGDEMIIGNQTSSPRSNQVDSSFNLFENMSVVESNTSNSQPAWLMQAKFESPIINFARSSVTAPPASPNEGVMSTLTATNPIITRGLWHQYGVVPTGSEGVFAQIINSPSNLATGEALDGDLAELVGMRSTLTGDAPSRIGSVARSNKLEEAVVAVPFTVGADGRRKFFRLSKWQINGAIRKHRGLPTQIDVTPTTQRMVDLMYKYVFPPTMDFVLNKNDVDPFAMYIFEFAIGLNQKDIADMWQNLPPHGTKGTSRGFQNSVASVQHPILANEFFDNNERKLSSKIRWMVFKVKKRCPIDYNNLRRANLRAAYGDKTLIKPNINTKYSYNWPYDYFSLVELIKIEEGIRYRAGEDPPEGSGNITLPIGGTDSGMQAAEAIPLQGTTDDTEIGIAAALPLQGGN